MALLIAISKGKQIGSSGLGPVPPKRPNSSPILSSVQTNPVVMLCPQVKYICKWAGLLKNKIKTKDKKAQKTSLQGIYFLPAKLLCFVCSNYFCYCPLWNLVDRCRLSQKPTSKGKGICLNTGPCLCIMKPSAEVASFQIFYPHSPVMSNSNPAILSRHVRSRKQQWSQQDCWTLTWEQLAQY